MEEQHPIGQGVQELIDRLHEEGIKSGREESENILREAKKEAARILDEAKKEAEALKAESHAKVEAERTAAHEMLQAAGRDAILTLREQLMMQFEHHIKGVVEAKLSGTEFLEKLILTVAKEALSRDEKAELSVGTLGMEETEADNFIKGLMAGELAEGITITPYGGRGIRLKIEGGDVVIDLSREALSELIFRLLTPRYRAIFEGVGAGS
jgi:V/A-type H+-transporting ATPase subunit E